MRTPNKTGLVLSKEVQWMFRGFSDVKPDEETKWLLQHFKKQLMEKCGQLSIVDKKLFPLVVLTILRKRKVSWQMVL
jgi:hypothetical protein